MPVSVTMPRLGESVSEGTVTRWLKQEGESVEADEPLLEVSTDKVDTEIPAPASGVVSSIRVNEDETVEVGVELAVIDEAGGSTGPDEGAGQAAGGQDASGQDASGQAAGRQDAGQQVAGAEQGSDGQRPAGDGSAVADQATAASEASSGTPEPAGQPAAAPASDGGAAQSATPSAPPASSGGTSGGTSGGEAAAGGTAGSNGAGAYVTPLVRKLAAEHSVDLSTLTGTGVGGRIRKQDVLAAAQGSPDAGAAAPDTGSAGGAQPAGAPEATSSDTAAADAGQQIPTPARDTTAPAAATTSQPVQAAALTQVRGRTEKLSRLRQVIARRMTESLQTSAQLTTVVEVDITRIARLRQQAKAGFEQREGTKLSFLPFFAVAAVEALKAHPAVNSSIDLDAGTVTYHDSVHLGIAVDTERGLLVPVIHGAQDLNLGGMARKIADLAERTRKNAVSPDELGGGTFTVTNTGSRGALFDTPILNQPQVGILGTGAVVRRPAVVDDPELGEVVAIRSVVYLALTYDHRIVDGADGARFLTSVKSRLEEAAFGSDLGL